MLGQAHGPYPNKASLPESTGVSYWKEQQKTDILDYKKKKKKVQFVSFSCHSVQLGYDWMMYKRCYEYGLRRKYTYI